MLLEERTADVFIETVGEVVIDVDQPFLQDVAGHAVFDAEHEQACPVGDDDEHYSLEHGNLHYVRPDAGARYELSRSNLR